MLEHKLINKQKVLIDIKLTFTIHMWSMGWCYTKRGLTFWEFIFCESTF